MKRAAFFPALLFATALLVSACCTGNKSPEWRDMTSIENPAVKLGVEALFDSPAYFSLIEGKRVALLTNPSGVDSKLRSTIDLLYEHPDVELVALFGPEHGIRGEAYAGDKVATYQDEQTGVTVYSLYGSHRRPDPEMLEGVDVMLYDIQDVGSSSYTYIYSMAFVMEECAKLDIPFVVLDRPNPCGADYVDGMVLDTTQVKSMVGYYDIAYMYGLTPGETAYLFNEEFLDPKVDLTVVRMDGYERSMCQWDTGLPFVPTSTHIPTARHAYYYSLTGILGELRNDVNIGVGYTLPFETIAAPWIDRDEYTAAINAANIPGIYVRPITYTPKYAGYADETVEGVHILISDYRKVRPVTAQIYLMAILQELYPEQNLFAPDHERSGMFHKVSGGKELQSMLHEGKSAEEIIASFQDRLEEFKQTRAKYLLYD